MRVTKKISMSALREQRSRARDKDRNMPDMREDRYSKAVNALWADGSGHRMPDLS